MKAVILAGGKNDRLLPLTKDFPEIILPIGNIPLIFFQMEFLGKIGIDEVIITAAHDPKYSKSLLGEGERFGIRITYIVESKRLGTAGAIKNISHLLDGDFIVTNGDILLSDDLTKAKRKFESHDGLGLMVISEVENFKECGMAFVNGGGILRKFIEKPDMVNGEENRFANAGVYFFKKEVLNYIPENKYYSIENHLLPEILDKNILTYKTEKYWKDIGTLKRYKTANFDLLNEKFTLDDELRTMFISQIDFENKYLIGKETILNEGVKLQNSIIGSNCFLEKNVTVENSIIWNGVTIREGSEIVNSIICKGCQIGKNVKLSKNIILGNNTVVSDYSKFC